MINLPFVSLVETVVTLVVTSLVVTAPVTTEIRDTKIISIFYVAENEIT